MSRRCRLYRHVRNKGDMLDGMVDLVFAEIELPPTDTDWKTAKRHRATSAHEVLMRGSLGDREENVAAL